MFGLLIRKTFYDWWDNFFSSFVLNIVFTLILAIVFLLQPLYAIHPALGFAVLVVAILLLFVYTGAISQWAWETADYKDGSHKRIFHYLKETWKFSLILGAFWSVVSVLMGIAIPVYTSFDSLMAMVALFFIGWSLFFVLLALQYYFPVRSQLDNDFKKMVKKSFLIFFDNPLFTIQIFLGTALILALSTLLLFAPIAPSFCGVMLWVQNALKLRLKKYDFLEEVGYEKGQKIPWRELVAEENEQVGRRSFRDFFTPWKH